MSWPPARAGPAQCAGRATATASPTPSPLTSQPCRSAIESQARTLWNISTLTTIVLAGGGALALKPWLAKRFKQAIYAPDAAMANARGFLLYGLRQWGAH